MRRRLFTSLAAVLLETGWALAQVPGTAPSGPVPADIAGSTQTQTLIPASAAAIPPTAAQPMPAPAAPPAAAMPAPCGSGACGTGTCGEAPACGPVPDCYQDDSRFWFSGEYLLWHLKNGPVPPLSVQSTVPLSVPAAGGTVNFSFQNTTIFPEGQTLDYGDQQGWRFSGGLWLDPEKDWGIDGSYFQLERRTAGSNAQQTTDLDVDTPFFALFTVPVPGALPFVNAVPSELSGTLIVNVHEAGDTKMWGTDANIRSRLWYFGALSFDVFAGARYMDLREDLVFTDNITVLPNGPLTIGTSVVSIPALGISTLDAISTRDQFLGPQVGFAWDWHYGRVFFDGFFKTAVGDMHQNVNVFGANVNSAGVASLGGALFSPSDIGEHTRDQIGYVLEVNPNIGVSLTPWCRAYVGYNMMFLQNVNRPGGQIGYASSTSQVTFAGTTTNITNTFPQFKFDDSSAVLQGVNFGVEIRY
jgi:Putative beta barrel porin-7 (BBP7)